VRGGNYKFRALRLDHGNFSWGTEVRQQLQQPATNFSSGLQPTAYSRSTRIEQDSSMMEYSIAGSCQHNRRRDSLVPGCSCTVARLS
jgi:hypothetical protein